MNFRVKINGIWISGTIIKGKRRGISLEILPIGTLVVRVPKRYNKSYILNVIKANEEWIYKKVKLINEKNNILINREYTSGESYLLLGEYYKLNVTYSNESRKVNVDSSEKTINLLVDKKNNDIRSELLIFYKEFALKYIQERIEFYLSKFNHIPKEIRVKEQKRRWGSCTGDNKLLFNWKIIMAPKEVIDYLVIHEMSHMEHKNHSKDFWNSVGEILKDYKSYRIWLKENGVTLEL